MKPDTAEGDRSKVLEFWIVFLLRSWAATVEALLHRAPAGRRWPGSLALGGGVLILLFGGLFPDQDPRPLLIFLVLFLLACMRTRAVTALCSWRGGHEYGWYTGRPWLLSIVPRAGELALKRFVEPLLVVVASALVISWSVPLGMYLLGAAFSVFVTVNTAELHEQHRALEMYDQAVLQKQLAERFRRIAGPHF